MVRVLKDERGRERQAVNNAGHKRAEVASKPRPFSGREFLATPGASRGPSPLSSAPGSDVEDMSGLESDGGGAASGNGNVTPGYGTVGGNAEAGLARAKEHRDRLLNFQSNNAKRTRIYDEAADFDVPASGTNMWASPQERALQLKRQQKVLREMEWSARPEYEKRKMVASIDVVGGKVVRRMVEAERPKDVEDDQEDIGADEEIREDAAAKKGDDGGKGGGAFSKNPLMGSLIRPVARQEKGKEANGSGEDGVGDEEAGKGIGRIRNTWRRVQDDNDDNEQWILDGGVYGGRVDGRVLGEEEHAVGS